MQRPLGLFRDQMVKIFCQLNWPASSERKNTLHVGGRPARRPPLCPGLLCSLSNATALALRGHALREGRRRDTQDDALGNRAAVIGRFDGTCSNCTQHNVLRGDTHKDLLLVSDAP